ncbi:LacI family DNA-binding transcriptional regulator [Rhizobium mongolense]
MAVAKNTSGVRPSIHSVAAYAGVSIATVSKVIQGDKTVRPENVKSVQNAIEALGYRINPLAAGLRRGRRNLVGVIVPTYDDPYYASLVGALERQAETRGYAIAATSSRNSEMRELELVGRMEDWRVSGVILVPVKNENGSSARTLHRRILVPIQNPRNQTQRLANYLVEQLQAAAPGAYIQVLPSPSRREKVAEALAEIFG